ncbi:MAG: C25 family cysteine peptidase [Candidatus Thermoplasmatota archaeon]
MNIKKILPILVAGLFLLNAAGAFAIESNETTSNNIEKSSTNSEYDLLIITHKTFTRQLQRLVDHKEEMGIKTIMETTDNIYQNYDGRDKPEKIKYFVKHAYDEWNIKYLLLVGGLKSKIYARPRDTANYGADHWYVPVRYTNFYDNPKHPLNTVTASASDVHDPGVISDLYYADIYDENDTFSSWDPNNDDYFAVYDKPGVEKNDSGIDYSPEIAVGRLACRNRLEVKNVVDKIIHYEKNTYGKEWFKKMTVVSGDGFLDQEDLDFQWNSSGLPSGEYTIYGQSTNKEGVKGNLDIVKVTVNHSSESSVTFNHDDNLQVNQYPALPIAEITSPSDGDVLGKDDVSFDPQANDYCNEFTGWANVSYENKTMHIRGKSYDPKPYGNTTNMHIWVENEDGEKVFNEWRNNTEMYYEGEWVTGDKKLMGRGGALYYMPDEFKKNILWASNGGFSGEKDVMEALNEGNGFVFMSGHGSPNVWADHYPGVPGDRSGGSVTGLRVTTLKPHRLKSFLDRPYYPMNKLSNDDKLPVMVIGGCHNSQFNVSLIPTIMHILYYQLGKDNQMWTYGSPVPECFSWNIVRLKEGGAIATIGNTGLGYGRIGKISTTDGGDGWITIEFFRQYGEHGHEILGEAFMESIKTYVDTFDMSDVPAGHAKTVQQWVLLGDPSLKIGGYPQ